jgi:hypothetical protein
VGRLPVRAKTFDDIHEGSDAGQAASGDSVEVMCQKVIAAGLLRVVQPG